MYAIQINNVYKLRKVIQDLANFFLNVDIVKIKY